MPNKSMQPAIAAMARVLNETQLREMRESAEAQLIKMLVDAGHINAAESATMWYEIASREHNIVHLFHEGGVVGVDLDGQVERY